MNDNELTELLKKDAEERAGEKRYNPFCTSVDWLDCIALLTLEERGQLFTSLLTYARDGGTVRTDNKAVNVVFEIFKPKIDSGFLGW